LISFNNNYMIWDLQIWIKYISNKSCQCRSTDYWADNNLGD